MGGLKGPKANGIAMNTRPAFNRPRISREVSSGVGYPSNRFKDLPSQSTGR